MSPTWTAAAEACWTSARCSGKTDGRLAAIISGEARLRSSPNAAASRWSWRLISCGWPDAAVVSAAALVAAVAAALLALLPALLLVLRALLLGLLAPTRLLGLAVVALLPLLLLRLFMDSDSTTCYRAGRPATSTFASET